MYYKLVELTESDAIEGLFTTTTKQTVAVTPAHNEHEASLMFEYMAKNKSIRRGVHQKIMEATPDEFDAFITDLLEE